MPDCIVLGADANWDAYVEALPEHLRDVHFTSAFARTQREGEALLLVLETEEGPGIFQPVLLRKIPTSRNYHDIYWPGYGGPLGDKTHAAEFKQFKREWCQMSGVVSEFCCVNPLLAEAQLPLLEKIPAPMRDVVIIDLQKLSASTVSRRVRRGVRKATDAGLKVVRVQELSRFRQMYATAMQRKNASGRWLLTDAYWEAFEREMKHVIYKTSGSYGERMLLVFGKYQTAYAYLLASNGLASNDGLDEFLYWQVAHDLRNAGFRYFHLGGGTTNNPDDSLLAFKRGFSGDKNTLAAHRHIYDQAKYDELCAQSRGESDFFPAYRSEAA